MKKLKIAIAQINTTVGDLAGNAEKITDYYRQAERAGADLIVFPELTITGYPAEDLVLNKNFQQQSEAAVAELAKLTSSGTTAILLGGINYGHKLYNTCFMLLNGNIHEMRYKQALPNYGVFDEKRVFVSGSDSEPIIFKGVKLGILICEDIWQKKPIQNLKGQGAEVIICLNGSPFEKDKHLKRVALVSKRAQAVQLPVIYVNLIGGQDNIVFDGGSFTADSEGNIVTQLDWFREQITITEWCQNENQFKQTSPTDKHQLPAVEEQIYSAAMLGLRNYVLKNNFSSIILGLSGGIDSAIVAAIAVDALGNDKVHAVMLPSKYTSPESLADAEKCAKNLAINLQTIPINDCYNSFNSSLEPHFKGFGPDITEENLQARIRGVMLMALSNKFGHLLLSTGNKSEIAVGYATLYGDMCGAYNPIRDIYKTEIYKLTRWRNANKPAGALGREGIIIPESIIDKAPTAELRPNQKDQDSLPPYELLDDILEKLIEQRMSVIDLINMGYDAKIVEKITKLFYRAEYKRRQAAPGPKISSMSFGNDRRFPMTNKWNC